MKYSRLWVAATIIAFFVLVGFVLSVPHTKDIGKFATAENAAPPMPAVSLTDSYKKGVHTISGSLRAPNACTAVTAHASLAPDASGEDAVLVALSVTDDAGICLQVATPIYFTVTLAAPARLPVEATINGAAASTTVL